MADPVRPAEYVAPAQLAMAMPGTVQSVVECPTNGPLIAVAAQLWMRPDDLVVDVTYGRGNFWTRYRPGRLVAHDLVLDGVDFRQLPEADASVDVVVFDPPYIPQGGRETSTLRSRGAHQPGDGNVRARGGFLERYGLVDGPRTVPELEALFAAGMKEATRVLRPGGRLLVKCMDYVNSGRYVAARHFVVATALELGLRQVDEFVHYSGLGPQPSRDVQKHSRRAHSFLCVFEVPPRRRRPGAALIDGTGCASQD